MPTPRKTPMQQPVAGPQVLLEDLVVGIPGARRIVLLFKAAGRNPFIAIVLIFCLGSWWVGSRTQDVAIWFKPMVENVVTTHLSTVTALREDTEKKTEILQHMETTLGEQQNLLRQQGELLEQVHRHIIPQGNARLIQPRNGM